MEPEDNGHGHDLRIEASSVLDASGACVPAARLVCSCGFSSEPIARTDVLNHIATHHLQAAARIERPRRRRR